MNIKQKIFLGMNSRVDQKDANDNQCYDLFNGICGRGYYQTRPGCKKMFLTAFNEKVNLIYLFKGSGISNRKIIGYGGTIEDI